MKNRNLLKIASIILALVSLAIGLFFWGELSGFEKGYFYGIFQNPPQTGTVVFTFNHFQSINIWYFIITVGFCVYIIGKFLKPLLVSSSICILSLSIVFYPFWDMLQYKNEMLNVSHHYREDFWFNISIYFDWFLLFATIILMFTQFTLFITRKLNTETFKII